jgi:hypothetical protein
MKKTDFPALYRAADAASNAIQGRFLWSLRAYLALTVVGSTLALFGINSRALAIAAAVTFLVGFAISIYMAVSKPESTWYRARAVAESVKTLTWRYMSRAEPFGPGLSTEAAKKVLLTRLREVLSEHKDLAAEFAGSVGTDDQVTKGMVAAREKALPDRIAWYLQHRVKEQREWYTSKSNTNRLQGRGWLVLFVALQAGAILVLLLRIADPDFKYWPATVLAAMASVVLTWTQTKRFRELAAAYALTAHEIGLAEAGFAPKDDPGLSQDVDNMENAFSREHTQWVARKTTR